METGGNHSGPAIRKLLCTTDRGPSFWKNAFFNSGASLISLATQLFLVVALANLLPISEYAAYIAAAAIVAVGEMASDSGARIWAVRQFATSKAVSGNLGALARAKFITSSVFGAGLFLAPIETLPGTLLLPVILIAVSQPATDPLLWLLRGRERLDVEASIIVFWRLATVFLLVLAALFGYGIETLLVLWCISNILRVFITSRLPVVRALLDKEGPAESAPPGVFRILGKSLPIGAAFFAMTLFQRLGVFMLDQMGTDEDIAIYGAAFTLVASAGFVGTAITVSSFPSLAKAVKAGNASRISSLVNSTVFLVTIAMLCISMAGMLLSPLIFTILYPDTFSTGASVMAWLLPGLLVSSVNFSLKYTLNAMNLNWADLATVLAGLVMFVAIMQYGPVEALPVRAAFSWVCAELFIFLLKASILLWKRMLGPTLFLAILAAFTALEAFGFYLN